MKERKKERKKQELLGQFSSTVEQKPHHWEGRSNDEKKLIKKGQILGQINLNITSKYKDYI
jgi:hypothetical protein